MPFGKRIGLKDRERDFALASQGLSIRQISERMGVSFLVVKHTLRKGLQRCAQCGRVIDRGGLCPVCSLPMAAPLGDRLKAWRTVAGLSQMALALRIRVHESTLRNWAKGKGERYDPLPREITSCYVEPEVPMDTLSTVGEIGGPGDAFNT
jgi:hypothetical protein